MPEERNFVILYKTRKTAQTFFTTFCHGLSLAAQEYRPYVPSLTQNDTQNYSECRMVLGQM